MPSPEESMFLYHHVLWEYISYLFAAPTLLLCLYRFLFCTPWREGWSKFVLREKNRTLLHAFDFTEWRYDRSVESMDKVADDHDVK